MRFFVTVFAILNTASGDMCQDFCLSQLSDSGCPKGSWCKNDHDCHGLFWTNADRRNVCVLESLIPCTDHYPVLCHEASAGLLNPSPRQSIPTSEHDMLSFIDMPFLQPSTIASNPLVKITYLREGRNLGYWAVFDSASWHSYVLLEQPPIPGFPAHLFGYATNHPFDHNPGEPISRPANLNEGYLLDPRSGMTPTNPGTLAYGGNPIRYISHSGTIEEQVRIFSGPNQSFEFNEPNLYLVHPPGDGACAILGSGYSSAFAMSAGSFALIPGSEFFDGYRMVIGRGASGFVEQFCANGQTFNWYPLTPSGAWTIEGYITLGDSPTPVELFIDTGATKVVFVTGEILDRVREILRSSLGLDEVVVQSSFPDAPTTYMYSNCTDYVLPYLPTVIIGFGTDPTQHPSYPLEFAISPYSYLEFFANPPQCQLLLINGQTGHRDRMLISNSFLMPGISVFDRDNARFGYCPKNTSRIAEYIRAS